MDNKKEDLMNTNHHYVRRTRRHSKTLVELTIGMIGLIGLLVSQLGHSSRVEAVKGMDENRITSQMVRQLPNKKMRDRHLVTFLTAQTAVKNCQASWLSILL